MQARASCQRMRAAPSWRAWSDVSASGWQRRGTSSGTSHAPISSEEASGSFDSTSTDRSRLQQRLHDYSLCERVVEGDGNCQVRLLPSAVSHAGIMDSLREKWRQLKWLTGLC